MLIVTDPNQLNILSEVLKDVSVYNISSMLYNTSIPSLSITPNSEMLYNAVIANARINTIQYDIDQVYASFLMTNSTAFMQLMQVVRDLYFGKNVILLVYREENVFDPATESLCKFIQQRYGYNYQMVNDYTDLNIYDSSSFSVPGITAFDNDNIRYLSYVKQFNVKAFMDEKISLENGGII